MFHQPRKKRVENRSFKVKTISSAKNKSCQVTYIVLLEEVKKPRLGNNIDFFHINLAFFSEAVGTCPFFPGLNNYCM